ncbi:Nodulation protein D 2 [Pigmentiphaga humi]|uniref:Nodulation protein D 2 n=1 Tax=Pigmentiphaga humi TaxID=2478468 RepID=A0A3P4AY17_9BURK|nr:LysR family transcriptional regulator [Pigmentiphaga humi]VCU68969.1 Nodulation protein D 2 [Pigmentiphaga humi]
MDIRHVDLNLLRVFDAMLEHRSVSRAAEAIGLSQPAMSAAVARLRALFDDALFVRTGAQMQPTPRAVALAPAVRRVMETVKGEILQAHSFDPAASERTFTLITPDIGEINFVPRLLARLVRAGSGLNLRTLSMPRHAAAEALESGEAELAIGYFPDLHKAGMFQQLLFRNTFVCIVRADHPDVGDRLTLGQYLALPHAAVRPGREHLFEEFLQRKGLERRVLLETSHFTSLMPIIETSDLVATVPRDMANVCVQHANIRMLDVPLEAPTIEVHQFWPRRFHKDAGNMWLRGVLHELFRA